MNQTDRRRVPGPVPVLLGRGVSNHPGFIEGFRQSAAIVAALPDGVRIVVEHNDPRVAAMRKADVAVVESLHGKGSPSERYVSHCLEVCAAHDIEVFFPGRDLPLLADRAGEFAALGTRLLSATSPVLLRVLDDKLSTYDALTGSEVRIPEARRVVTLAEFDAAYADMRTRYPVVCIKPARSIFARGFRVIREDLDPFEELLSDLNRRIELDDLRRRLAHEAARHERGEFPSMLLMPFLSGAEWSVDAFRARPEPGSPLTLVPRRKLSDTQQELRLDEELIAASTALADRFKLQNLFNIQFKEEGGDGPTRNRPYLLEINARAAGGVGMAVAAGVDLPGLALLNALGLPLPAAASPHFPIRYATDTSYVAMPTAPKRDASEARPARDRHEVASVTLPTGHLKLRQPSGEAGGHVALGALVGIGARQNPKRGFVFVSRVLGKHLPVTPARMRTSHRRLAAALPADFPGPVLFIGLAETATGLGLGVFESWLAATGRTDALVVHTTRHPAESGRPPLRFDEAHSHAPDQFLCVPDGPLGERFSAARTVVIVDDELSTGRTALALANALRHHGCPLDRVIAAALVDLRGQHRSPDHAAVHLEVVALATGDFEFEASTSLAATPVPHSPTVSAAVGRGHQRWGRLGADSPRRLPDDAVARALSLLGGARRVTLIATGECMHPAFVLGTALEASGVQVLLQSTTRSPLLEAGAIRSRRPAPDLWGSAVPHAIYNLAAPIAGEARLVLHEVGVTEGLSAFCDAVGALPFEVPECAE